MPTRKCQTAIFAVLVVLALGAPVAAHDSWLIADKSVINDGDSVWFSFVTGEVFPLGEAATKPDRVASFVDRRGDRGEDVVGYHLRDKGLSIRRPVSGLGLHVVGCSLKPKFIEMALDTFADYLNEERATKALEVFAAQRKEPGAATQPAVVVEEYTKFAKTVIAVGDVPDEDRGYETPLGQRLEVIPLSNPCLWQTGRTVQVKVLFDGFPWADVGVWAGNDALGRHGYVAETRADAKGIASIKLDRPGHWFFKTHLIRPTTGLGRAKWESFWASLTFRVTGKVDRENALRLLRSVHGSLEPLGVAGDRMGREALELLGLPRGSADLIAVVRTPLDARWAAIADGVEAATGATAGRLNLRVEAAPSAEGIALLLSNARSGESVTLRLQPQFIELARCSSPEENESMAMKAATMEDGEIFERDNAGRNAEATIMAQTVSTGTLGRAAKSE